MHKLIQVNPYEIARLARALGISTSQVTARFTREGIGTILAQRDNGACVFLGSEGCTVHSDRPLVCRLYPLGRHVIHKGEERFSHYPPHPHSGGQYTRKGTIGSYLDAQGAAPFMRAADAYFAWACAAVDWLEQETPDPTNGAPDNDEALPGDTNALLDMDTCISSYCAEHSLPSPDDIEDRTRLHIAILHGYLGARNAKGRKAVASAQDRYVPGSP